MAGIRVTADTSDLAAFAASLSGAGRRAVGPAAKLVTETAKTIQDDLRAKARGHRKSKHFPRSITTDVRGLRAEIGPEKGKRQGALGNLLYFGSVNNGPVLEHPSEALARAAPAFLAGLADIGEQVLQDRRR
jgi:hypothetical protein